MRNRRIPILLALLGLAGLLLVIGGAVAAQGEPAAPATPSASPIHPVFPLLDASGANVLESGSAVSTMTTCGGCHDTAFIAANNFHSDAGLETYAAPGTIPGGRPWDTGAGLFGKWDPLLYRYLSPEGDAVVDLTTPEWVQVFGARHVGGGPGVMSREGRPLTDLTPGDGVEATLVDAAGQTQAWDWRQSGTAELNCFLCHWPEANNEARVAALAEGRFGDAVTATLVGSGLVDAAADPNVRPTNWVYNLDAFDEQGNLKREYVRVQDPTVSNCGTCHGITHNDQGTPLSFAELAVGDWNTLTTGQIMSPQRIDASGLNIAGKEALGRSWDVHMERVLDCTDCHYSLNNPVYYQEKSGEQPAHLAFDPRRLDLGEYTYRPLHQFAKGQSAQGTLASSYDGSLRRCESCHDAGSSHEWLPYVERHTAAVACESCHIPRLYGPALQSVDWTVLDAAGEPVRAFRGLEGDELGPDALLSGYEPVLLPRANKDGTTTIAPFNLITSWYWVYGEPSRPVPLRALQAAYFDGNDYAPEIVSAFDANSNGALSRSELSITTDEQEAAVAQRLSAAGLDDPRIAGEVQPYGINHDVVAGEWATKDCRACHGSESRLAAPLALSDRTPGGAQPTLYAGGPVSWPGGVTSGEGGALRFVPDTGEAGLYVLGHNAVDAIDWLGILMVLGVMVGVVAHGGLRFWSARRRAREASEPGHGAASEPGHGATRQVYMYDVYERLWHWLQTAAILLLLFTGLIIHEPDKFGIFSFSYVVQVHNILALLLVVNAGLSLFYHLASGEIRQFIPRPRGFFDEAFRQGIYYVRGIFRNEPHPFEKTRQRKMNPLQQVTYVMVLNVLLPLQIITGALMWGAQRWPQAAAVFGGLPGLGPFHTLVAWTFAAFIILHVYLTTTGPTPLAGMEAMILGYEDVEVHEPQPAAVTTD